METVVTAPEVEMNNLKFVTSKFLSKATLLLLTLGSDALKVL